MGGGIAGGTHSNGGGLSGRLDESVHRARSRVSPGIILFDRRPLIAGPSDIEHIWQLSWRKTFYRGGPVFMSALAGLDIALWDLKGIRSL